MIIFLWVHTQQVGTYVKRSVIESVLSLRIPAIELRRFYRCSCTVNNNNNNIHYSIIITILLYSVDFYFSGPRIGGFRNKVNQNSGEPCLIDCIPDIVHNPTGGAFYLI